MRYGRPLLDVLKKTEKLTEGKTGKIKKQKHEVKYMNKMETILNKTDLQAAPEMPQEGPASSLGGKLPKACILYGYPSSTNGHGAKILQTAMGTLQAAGAEFDVLNLYSMDFEPVMSAAEADNYGQNVPEDVKRAQEMLAQAPVWIIVYPVWWSSPPAMLKGFFDRVLTPGFAFTYHEGKSHPMLENKRALVVRTYGGSATQEQENGHAAHKLMENAILGFCGVKSVAVDIYSVSSLAPTAFNHALFQLKGAVRRLLSTPTGVPHSLRSVPAPYLPPIERMMRPGKPGDAGKSARGALAQGAGEEEKPPLSQSAQEDLEFFKAAKKQAVEKVHSRAGHGSAPGRSRYDGRGGPGGGQYDSRAGQGRQQNQPQRGNRNEYGNQNRRAQAPAGPGRTRDRGFYSGRSGGSGRADMNAPRQGNAPRPGGEQWKGGSRPGNERRRDSQQNRKPRHKGRRF